ncbi:uncharacterized protein LOC105192561 [Harpegnathos saltator]|uniref:uncharacterized protein LOC105192561 n=1 Tax=Harpegnathos saltator TaxID=610380 RepID=UPI000DBED94B|nr:uncharacterized protein LOC105192561 [Harpegnathos saltator]
MRFEQRQPRETNQKGKRCSAHLRKSRFSPSVGRARNSDGNVNMKTSRDIPYVSARNPRYSTESSAATSWTMETRNENKTLLRALQDSLKDAQDANVDSREETKKCNTFVCYCQEENCVRKSSRTSSSRTSGSSRRKLGRTNRRRPTEYEYGNTGPVLEASVLRPESPRWYHEARHEPHVLGLINSVPIQPPQEIMHPAFFAPFLHGVPLVAPSMIGKDDPNVAFPSASFDGRPDFAVGSNNVNQHQRGLILRQGSQEWPQENRHLDTVTVPNTSSASIGNLAAMINLSEENGTTDFSISHETVTVNHLDATISSVTENDVLSKETIETSEINEADISPGLRATLSTDHVVSTTEAGASGNFESYSLGATIGADLDEQFPSRFITTPEISVRTGSEETKSHLNPYYSETTTMSTSRSESSTDLLWGTTLPWTDRPYLKAENNYDQTTKIRNVPLTSTNTPHEYTRRSPTELYLYVATSERTDKLRDGYNVQWYPDASRSPDSKQVADKSIPMKKLAGQTIDEIEESTRGELLEKSKSHATMLLGSSYDGESTTASSAASEKFYSTISHESNVDDYVATNTIHDNSETSIFPFNPRSHGGKTTTSYYDLTTERKLEEATADVLMESITETYSRIGSLQDQLTEAEYLNCEETKSDDNKGDLEYTTESLVKISDLSTKRLPFYDNSLLLNSIRRVINNFALDSDLAKAQDLDEDALRAQGKSLLPEILQIPNLKDILSSSLIKDTIVGKVKGILSKSISETNGWSHDVIRNALRDLLEGFHSPHHVMKSSPIKVEEHQFNNGLWNTKLVTLPPVHEEKSGKPSTVPRRLWENIRDLLGSPAVASQADRQIVRNMIVQSLKNSLAKTAEREINNLINDTVILDTLNGALQWLRGSQDMSAKDASKESEVKPKVESANDEEAVSISRGTSTCYESVKDDYETKGELEESVTSDVKQFEKDTPLDGTETRRMSYQKVKKLNNNVQVLIVTEPSDLIELGKPYEGKDISLTLLPGATTEAFQGIENVLNSMSMEPVEAQQNDEEARDGESWERTTTYQQSSETYISQATTGRTNKDVHTTEGTDRDSVLDKAEHVGEQEPSRITISVDNIEVTIASAQSNPRTNELPETSNEESNVVSRTEAVSLQNEATPLVSRYSETNTQEKTTREFSSSCGFLKETNEISSTKKPEGKKKEILTFGKIAKWNSEVTTNLDEVATEITKQNSFTTESLIVDEAEAFDKQLAVVALAPNLMSSSADDERQSSTINVYNESYSDVGTAQDNTMNPMKECSHKYDEMDPAMMRATNIDVLPISYYSPNNRVLDYVKNHRVDNEDETTPVIVSSMRKSSSDYARPSEDATLNQGMKAAANTKQGIIYVLNENVSSPSEDTASNSTLSANDDENRKMEATVFSSSSSSSDVDSLQSQQQKFQTGDMIKIHEVTTEVEKTYAKTVYFQPRQFDLEDNSRTNSLAIALSSTASSNDNFSKNGNSKGTNNDPRDKKLNDIGIIVTEANKNIDSATESSTNDISDTLQLFPTLTASEESIAQLQRSQLYYIDDGIKLPLEIKKLKDGTYTLSVSKNICELILKRKCCVPLQGHVLQSSRPDTHMSDVEEDYQLNTQLPSATITLRNTLQKLEELEEKLNLTNGRRKRDLIESDSKPIISMPVLDFVKKYNLSLDFNEDEVPMMEFRSSEKIRNSGNSLKQLVEESEESQMKEKNRDVYSGKELIQNELQNKKENKVDKLQGSMNIRDEDILGGNVENLMKAKLQKSREKVSRSKKVKTSRLSKLEAENDNQRSMNINQIMDPDSREDSFISKETDISKGETKFKSNEMKWGDFEILVKRKGEIPEEIKLVKLNKEKENEQHMDSAEQNKFNVPEVNIFKNMNGRPYRYQRNIRNSPNKGTEIIKDFLYWLKSLFLNTN